MMITVITLMQLVATISATAPHAENRHFRGPAASGSATQESLHKATEEAAKRVHEAAAAARKTAHGDGSDSFANYLEQSMMQLEKEDTAIHEKAKQESLHRATEDAAERVHKAAAAARKTAHGDGSDSFANYLEQSMMKLEQEDKAIHDKAKERIAQHELDHKVQLQIKHAHEVAHERAMHTSADQAYQQLHQTAERIRRKAHVDGSENGDGSDRYANELEQSIMELEEQKHENEFKAHERHLQHEREREAREERLHEQQAARAKEKEKQAALAKEKEHAREELLHAQEAALAQDLTAGMDSTSHEDESKKWANELEESILDLQAKEHDFEEKARLRRARHKLENQIDEELLHVMQPKKSNKFMAPNNHIIQAPVYDVNSASRVPGLDDDTSNDEVVQSASGLVLFLVISVIVFAILSWQKFLSSKDQCVVIPGLGKVNVIESERMVHRLIQGVAPNAGLAVYGDDARSAAPLKSAFGASKSTPEGYGIFTL